MRLRSTYKPHFTAARAQRSGCVMALLTAAWLRAMYAGHAWLREPATMQLVDDATYLSAKVVPSDMPQK